MYTRRHYTCPIKSKGVIAMLRFSSITRISFLLLPLMVCTPALAALSSPSAQVNQNIIQAREKQSRFLINQSRLTSRISGTDTHPSPLQSMSLQQAEARQIRLNAKNQLQRMRSSFPSLSVSTHAPQTSPAAASPTASPAPAGSSGSSQDDSLQEIHTLQSLYNQEQIAYYTALAEQENKNS